jgi:hypothetical protein
LCAQSSNWQRCRTGARLCVAEDGRQESQRHDAEGAHLVALKGLRFHKSAALGREDEQRRRSQLAHQHE